MSTKQKIENNKKQDQKELANGLTWFIIGLLGLGIYAIINTYFINHLTY